MQQFESSFIGLPELAGCVIIVIVIIILLVLLLILLLLLCIITEALSACHYIPEVRSNVFNILYHALNSENAELQQASHECMKRVSLLNFMYHSVLFLFFITFIVLFVIVLVFACLFVCFSAFPAHRCKISICHVFENVSGWMPL